MTSQLILDPLPQAYLLAIDPSLRNLGFGLLSDSGRITAAGLLKQVTDPLIDYHIRGCWMAHNVYQLICTLGTDVSIPINVVIETPANWFGPRGQVSKDNEAVQKLYYLVGAVIGILTQHPWVHSIWSVAPTWKGQTPKEIMIKRARSYARSQDLVLNKDAPDDTAEALLLARYALERYEPANETFSEPFHAVFQRGIPHQGHFIQEEFLTP